MKFKQQAIRRRHSIQNCGINLVRNCRDGPSKCSGCGRFWDRHRNWRRRCDTDWPFPILRDSPRCRYSSLGRCLTEILRCAVQCKGYVRYSRCLDIKAIAHRFKDRPLEILARCSFSGDGTHFVPTTKSAPSQRFRFQRWGKETRQTAPPGRLGFRGGRL